MVGLLIIIVVVFLILVISEILFKSKLVDKEVSRKLVHMGTGVVVAFSPYFMDWAYIQVLSLLFLSVILLSLKYKIFKGIHSVRRVTKGEILYAIGIGICAFLEPAPWIFTAAILHLAIADALAAVVGVKWGRRTRYVLLSHGKTMLGSLTFFYSSMLIMLGAYLMVEHQNLPASYLLFIVIPASLTLLENVSWYGLDNVTVPIMVIVLLSAFTGEQFIGV